MRKPLFIFSAVLLVLSNACTTPTGQKGAQHDTLAKAKPDTAKIDTDTSITIAAVGDIMLGTAYPNENTLPSDRGKRSFKAALSHLRNADVAFGNLEGVLLNKGEPAAMKLKFRSKPYLFKMPEHYGGVFKDAGFDILSIANNHTNDFGLAGRKSTIKVLDSLGIACAGLKTLPTKVVALKGIRYGFCAFSPNSQTVSLLDIKGASDIIRNLKQDCDLVIVSFHGGGEGVDFEHVPPADESFKGERRGNVTAFAHAAIDAGADVILGNGPHVSRAMEVYKSKLIAYSLGNFCTYRSVSVAGVCGLAPLLKLKINKNGRFLGGQIISFRQSHDKGLLPDSTHRAAKRIKALTEADIKEPGLTISATGVITPASIN